MGFHQQRQLETSDLMLPEHVMAVQKIGGVLMNDGTLNSNSGYYVMYSVDS